MERFLIAAYVIADIATLVYLLVMDAPDFNAWNWLIIIPVDIFLAQIWPIYWAVLHWVM